MLQESPWKSYCTIHIHMQISLCPDIPTLTNPLKRKNIEIGEISVPHQLSMTGWGSSRVNTNTGR